MIPLFLYFSLIGPIIKKPTKIIMAMNKLYNNAPMTSFEVFIKKILINTFPIFNIKKLRL